MNIRKTILLITLLLGMSFLYAQTTIDVDIINAVSGTYDIDITLGQPSTQPTVGSLTFTATSSTTTSMHLEFDESDICIDKIKATYNGSCQVCPVSAELHVDCDGLKTLEEEIGPDYGDEACYWFKYTYYNDVNNNCEELIYRFTIEQ